MSVNKKISFLLDGKKVECSEDETIWQVANKNGIEIPFPQTTISYEKKKGNLKKKRSK